MDVNAFLNAIRSSEIKRIAKLLPKGFHFACRYKKGRKELHIEFYIEEGVAYGISVEKRGDNYFRIEKRVLNKSAIELAEIIQSASFYREGGWL